MRRYLKHISSLILIPLTKWYLRSDRTYNYDGLKIVVKAGVFHPGLFSSTQMLLDYVKRVDVGGKVLELGCGSGLISIWLAAKTEAIVTGSDISSLAVTTSRLNAQGNAVNLKVIHSDLFENIPSESFEWILINPPYYSKEPRGESDFAWYCGSNFEYFKKLFTQLGDYTHNSSKVIMVLTKGCDLETIKNIAEDAGYTMEVVHEKNVLFDHKDYLFSIRKAI